MSNLLQVLIVDDHFVVRSGLAVALEIEDDIVICGEAKRGEEVLEVYQSLRPHVVLMDLQLPGISGEEATKQLLKLAPEAKILVYSTYTHEEEIREALDAGALGFVQKSSSRDELLKAIRLVAQGLSYVPDDLAHRLQSLRENLAITPREREILEYIAQGHANKQIAAELQMTEDTVKKHVSQILEKLHVKDRAQATAEAIRRRILKL